MPENNTDPKKEERIKQDMQFIMTAVALLILAAAAAWCSTR